MERAQLTIEKKANNPFMVQSNSANEQDTLIANPIPNRKHHLDYFSFLKPTEVKYFSVKVTKTSLQASTKSKPKSQSVRIGNPKKMEDKAQKLEAMRKKFGLKT